MGEMTPEAKAMIEEAIRIVREDKNDAWWRKRVEALAAKKGDTDPPAPPPPTTDAKDSVTPDTKIDPGAGGQSPAPEGHRSAYWGIWDE